MATLPQLIDVFAKHDGRDHATLTQFGRVVREAGFLPKGKRGFGAPQMTPENAVALLLGIYGASSPKEAPGAIKRFASLRPMVNPCRGRGPAFLRAIDRADTFSNALTALLVRIPEVKQFFRDASAHEDIPEDARELLVSQALGGWGSLTFRNSLRNTSAEMAFIHEREDHWKLFFVMDVDLMNARHYSPAIAVDRKLEVTFGLTTLADLHEAIRPPPPTEVGGEEEAEP